MLPLLKMQYKINYKFESWGSQTIRCKFYVNTMNLVYKPYFVYLLEPKSFLFKIILALRI